MAFFLCVIGLSAILFLAQFPLRRRGRVFARIAVLLVKIFLFLFTAFISISIISRITWNAGYLFGALYAALGGDILADLICIPVELVRKKKSIRIQTVMTILATLAFLIYGMVNMKTVRANELSFKSDKLKTSHTFVFFSDLHYGSAQTPEVVKKAMESIKSYEPEFIVLGGDITDDLTTKEEMETIYSLLGSTGVPVYYVYGNHDRQSHADLVGGAAYTPAELEETIRANGITILRDNWVQVADDLVLFGREDFSESSRLPVKSLPSFPKNVFVLSVDHSPYQYSEIEELGADFQMSGHTHAGQFFPLQLIYNMLGYDAYGFYRHGNTDVYVSSGISGWLFPFRTEAACHFEVVTLLPGYHIELTP